MTAAVVAPMRTRALAVLAPALRYIALEFGPLIAFWAVAATFGVKWGIATSILVILTDGAWRLRRGERFTRLYMLVSAMTLVFGAVDLIATNPFMLKYEAVVTNVVTGLAFVVGALGDKPLIEEAAEQRGADIPKRADVRRFFRIFTLLWAAYFFAKAALFFWLAWTLPMLQAMALRSLIGGVSLAVMIALSVTQGRRLFFFCRAIGILPTVDSEAGGESKV